MVCTSLSLTGDRSDTGHLHNHEYIRMYHMVVTNTEILLLDAIYRNIYECLLTDCRLPYGFMRFTNATLMPSIWRGHVVDIG